MTQRPTIIVEADGYSMPGLRKTLHPCPLAAAIRQAEQFGGALIEVKGAVTKRIDIGGPAGYQNKDNCAYWKRGPITNVTISGVPSRPASTIGPMRFWNGLGGVRDIEFVDLRIQNDPNEFAPILTAMNEVHGHITLVRCDFIGSGSNWNGRGMKWGIRGHGPARWTITGCTFEPAQEHSIYIDNPQGDLLIEECDGVGNGRTFMQITNRPTSGPSQFGNILVRECSCFDIDDAGGGGSDYTFVGCTGKLEVVNCESGNTKNGALVCWTDTSNGTYPVRESYSFDSVSIVNFKAVSRRATRPMISLSGIYMGKVVGAQIESPSLNYRLGGQYGGPRPNYQVEID